MKRRKRPLIAIGSHDGVLWTRRWPDDEHEQPRGFAAIVFNKGSKPAPEHTRAQVIDLSNIR